MSHSVFANDFIEALTVIDQIRRSNEYPVLNCYEDPDTKAHVIQIAVTGHKENDIHVTTEDGIIHIQATVSEADREATKQRRYYRRRLKIDDIDLKITVPDQLDIASLNAALGGGMLTLTIPLTPAYQKRLEKRDVKINA